MRTLRLVTPLVSLAVLLAGCGKDETPAAAGLPPAVPVNVATVISKPIRQWDEFNGRVAALDSVEVRPRVTGYIERIAFKEGDEVKQNDLLFVIDQRPYKAALDNALAQLDRARASVQLAQIQDRRGQQLVQSGWIARSEVDTRNATLAQANADVRAAEAAVATARLNVEYTEVRSPIAGRVSRALLTLGNLAQADQTVLTTVVSQDPVYVYFQPDEQAFLRYAELARKGQRPNSGNPVRVGLVGDNAFPYTGTVNFVDNQVDATTGTINARAVVQNPDRVFTPGLYARVQLEGSGEFTALLIDDKAVLTDQDRKYVYVLGPDNKALRKDIALGSTIDGLRIVRSGLQPTDKVVVSGFQKIFFPGAPVKPTDVPMVAPAVATN